MSSIDQSDRKAYFNFSRPFRQIATMLLCLVLVGAGVYLAYPRVAPVFLANPYLNGFIVFVFVIGVLACFWQVLQLVSSVRWIEGFAAERLGHKFVEPPRLLAPLAAMLRSRGAGMQLGTSSTRSILDSVATRIDEAREITRYIVSLLIFLGLLGTFYGLATTVPAVVDTIRSLAPQEGEASGDIFSRLMEGLEAQLGGMGVAFSSSLLGLAGSLVVGLLELFAGHGQNRFYRELEEWLSTITRVGYSSGDVDGGAGEFDSNMGDVSVQLNQLSKAVEFLSEQVQSQSPLATLNRMVEGQEAILKALTEDGTDPESRMRLRSMDVQLLRILEEMSAGRQESIANLRSDLSTLNKSVKSLQSGRKG